jgi:hypothetical protein
LAADLATALSTDNPQAFLRRLEPTLREEFRRDIEGLCASFDISSAIDVLREEGATLEVDWLLELKPRDGARGAIRRRERVTVETGESKGRLLVIRLRPRAFFGSP